MANPYLTMPKLKRAFQLLAAKVPQREICEQLHMGRGVLSKYKKAADECNLSYSDAGRMSHEDLERFLNTTKPAPIPISEQKKALNALVPGYVDDLLHNRNLTIQDLHAEYRKKNPEGYGYTQFKKAIRDYQYAHNLSYHNTYRPGEEMQIDFAGDKLWLTDKNTGEVTPVVVLVCILPYSGMGYAKALYNASMENFFGGLSDALTYYGGTTFIAKSDNMKQWVKKHDRYEPVFNEAAVEWAAYYNISLETCRVRHPRDKAPVEGLVMKVYNAVYAKLHNEVFYTLDSLNSRIYELMNQFNCRPSSATGRSRIDIFEAEEKPTLGELPRTPYRFRYRKEVKLTGSYHVEIEKHKYSVPYQYVGQQVIVTWDIDTVEIYAGNTRIATHPRKMTKGYSTVDSHMPPNHLEYKHGQGCNAAYFLEEAEVIGPYTKIVVDKLLKKNRHVEQSYQSCHGILALKRTYGKERLEHACERLKDISSVTYTNVKNILENNLDQAVKTKPAACIPQNEFVRGAEAFKI